jgi:uncharacterized membrane protein
MSQQILQGKITYSGLVIALVPQILNLCGIELSSEEQASLINVIITLAGIGIAIYGKWRASKREKELKEVQNG